MPGKEAELAHVDSRKPWNGLAERDRVSFVFYVDHSGSSGKSSTEGSKSGNQEAS